MKRFFYYKTPYVLIIFILLATYAGHGADQIGSQLKASAEESFEEWLSGFRLEALRQGISPETLQLAFSELRPIQRVIELDRSQPEFTLGFNQYLAQVISDLRVRKAKKMLYRHSEALGNIRQRFQVQPRFLLALWAIETDFGRNRGGFPVIDSLATLAHEGRRREYFSRELLDALRIVDAGYAEPARMMGSWAGAMGQLQFMPSKVLKYWVDYDENGRADIWESPDEALVSAGNYLSALGWNGGQTWGRRVKLPAGFDMGLAGLNTRKKLDQWQRLGLRRPGGGDLPNADMEASLIIVEPGGPAFLVYDNYRALLEWNRSHFFAVSVGKLADRIGY